MTTTEDTRTALIESIERWEDVARTGEPGVVCPSECSLCRAFMIPNQEKGVGGHCCQGCPVFQYTGVGYCGETPIDWFTLRNITKYRGTDTLRAKAKEEVELLKRLLSLEPAPEDDSSPSEDRANFDDMVEEALALGVEKWAAIARGERRVSVGPDDCSLCGLFYYQVNTCKGCPVALATGQPRCRGTPYTWFENEPTAISEYNYVFDLKAFCRPDNKVCIQAAKEANFLGSLMKSPPPQITAPTGWVDMMHPEEEVVAQKRHFWTIWDKRKRAPWRRPGVTARLYSSREKAYAAFKRSSVGGSDNYCVKELATID